MTRLSPAQRCSHRWPRRERTRDTARSWAAAGLLPPSLGACQDAEPLLRVLTGGHWEQGSWVPFKICLSSNGSNSPCLPSALRSPLSGGNLLPVAALRTAPFPLCWSGKHGPSSKSLAGDAGHPQSSRSDGPCVADAAPAHAGQSGQGGPGRKAQARPGGLRGGICVGTSQRPQRWPRTEWGGHAGHHRAGPYGDRISRGDAL